MKDSLPPVAKSILIVDDQHVFRFIIRHYLKEQSHVIYECNNGFEAVMHYRSTPVDIVIMDVNMPIMDGITAMKKIRALHPEANIVIQTSDTSDELRRQAIESGASAVVDKAHLKKLPAVIDSILATHAGAQATPKMPR